VKAFVVLRPGASASGPELQRFVGEALAAFKVPAQIELRAEPLPRNAAGKVMKPVLLGADANPFVAE
jgi:long-chain acyl-CoA synthetase